MKRPGAAEIVGPDAFQPDRLADQDRLHHPVRIVITGIQPVDAVESRRA